MSSKKDIANAFGRHLDNDQFEQAKQLLELDCAYKINGQTIIGHDQIINTYETNMLEGKKKFDELIWGKCKIVPLSESEYEVHFSDFLKLKGIGHHYKCKQRLIINQNNKISTIIHCELPGEKEKLTAYYRQVGLSD